MADAKRTCLIVASIISAKNFPPRPKCSLVVQAQFSKEVLSSDPVPLVEEEMKINTELAWEVSKKSLRQHKLNRTPIKLLCVAINNLTMKREDVGYVMLDLKTAKPKDVCQETSWFPVLNSSYVKLKPHLQLCLTLEQTGDDIKARKETVDPSVLSLTLHPTGNYFQLGPADAYQKMHLFSVTLQNPKNLPPLPDEGAGFHFHYNLFGSAIISEQFAPPLFSPERSAIQIKANKKSLALFLGCLDDLVVSLCCGSSILGKGSVLLSSLENAQILSCSLLLGLGGASVDVCVQVERFWVDGKIKSDVSAEMEDEEKMEGKKSKKSAEKSKNARRNLTQRLEDAACLEPPHSGGSTTITSRVVVTSPTEATSDHLPSDADSQLSPSHITKSAHSSRLKHKSSHHSSRSPTPHSTVDFKFTSNANGSSHLKLRSRHNSPSPSRTPRQNESSPSPNSSPPPHQNESSHKSPSTVSFAKVILSRDVPPLKEDFIDSSSSSNGVIESISLPSQRDKRTGGMGIKVDISTEEPLITSAGPTCRHLRFSLDMRSLRDITLEVGSDYYLRYSYSFFGCPYPVLVQPPVTLHYPGAILNFIQSFCSFDFVVLYKNFVQHVTNYPLTVEVWKVCLDGHDYIAGLAQVPLDKAFCGKKMKLQDGTVRQMTKLVCPVFSSKFNISALSTTVKDRPALATLDFTLMLEDMGPSSEKMHPTSVGKINKKADREENNVVKSRDREDKDVVKMRDNDADSRDARVRSSRAHQPKGVGFSCQAKERSDVEGVDRVVQVLIDSPEYKVALELEKWRASEEEAFLEHLKTVEASHMSHLGNEWKKRETQGQELLAKKFDHYTSLEKKLRDGLQKLKKQQKILEASEEKMAQDKERHMQEMMHLKNKNVESLRTAGAKYEQSQDLGRHRAVELQYQVDLLKKQVREQEAKLHSRNAEFEKFQKEVVIPQSKLQGDFKIAQLEKAELERKVSSLTVSKENYKKKWKETLSELVNFHKYEQDATREKLLSQDKELAALRVQFIQQEEEGGFNLQIGQVKDDLKRLEVKVSSGKSIPKSHPSPAHHSRSPSPAVVTNSNKALTADVARWIEERDVLLHTGLYCHTDVIIQNLDQKIESAMLKITT